MLKYNHSKIYILIAYLFMSTFFCSELFAEQKIQDGDYIVHYSAIPTTALSAKMAASYGFERSSYRALLNITPQKLAADGTTTGVKSHVSGKATNLIGNTKDLEFKEIVEGDVVYYIADFGFSNEEYFRFSIDIQPLDKPNKTIPLKFEKKFLRDE